MLTGDVLKKIAINAFEELKNISNDNKINCDIYIEKYVIDEILKYCSDIVIISEECGRIKFGKGIQSIVLDPIDGTGNYMRGIPIYSICIALVNHNKLIIDENDIEYSIVVSTFGIFEAYKGALGKTQVNVESEFDKALIRRFGQGRMRLLGASSIELGLLADGSIDAFIDNDGLKLVDIIPILLYLKNNNCIITDLQGYKLKFILDNPKNSDYKFIASRSKMLHKNILSRKL
ncbi:inositol monophosphatase family protein [Paraclostridium bifermentans]|uniref:Inositol monophosphatase n=1 Tax=Paraclostridium bifermentans TaxID=1490 RepID=A0A5P3XBY7_PARBF|nr:inositol monophosphatase family protein [Paraclostridium bifermentans]MBN8046356.1 hypothetical protein [Paraclostridium bifermentans]MBZ6005328.1 hypothetical protein [Paraclostridium bifermentans]NME09598.1 hypothetical protein [Paraclostridium bifermentans]QEZ68606.1 hypothetical protein D4A35_06500 [Paraclostridium bifermentans]